MRWPFIPGEVGICGGMVADDMDEHTLIVVRHRHMGDKYGIKEN